MTPTEIFVFGSNLAGRHGKGAARYARDYYAAEYGRGIGRTGQAYGIPTKDGDLRPLSLPIIAAHVAVFLDYARTNPNLTFLVTRIGCGLAGYSDTQIAPFFREAPANCLLPGEWYKLYN